MKNLVDEKTTQLIFVLLFGCLAVCIMIYFYLGGYLGFDIEGHWRISAYTLKGYNPYLYIGKMGPLAEIGDIPFGFSTVPWACVLGNFFYGGFLPLEIAKIYNVLLHFFSIAFLCAVIYLNFKNSLSKFEISTLCLAIVSQFSIMYSIYYGNAGGIICCFLIAAIILSDKHPYVAGVLIGLAMVKPQIAAIVCIIFLVEKKWKSLFTGAFIDIIAWGITSAITDTSPISLLTMTFSSGTASEFQYLGLLSVFQYIGIEKSMILILNILIGLIYTIGLWYYLKKNQFSADSSLVLYMASCIASVFWIYKNGTDYAILGFITLLFCLLCFKKKLNYGHKLLSFVCICFLQMSRLVVYIGITFWGELPVVRDALKSAEGMLLLVIGFIFSVLWVKTPRK